MPNPVHEFLRQYPDRTARLYRSALAEFERLTGTPPEHATRAAVLAYQADLEARLAPGTVAWKLAAVGSLMRYLTGSGVRDDDPMRGIRRAKYHVDPASTVKWLDQTEAARLLAACSEPRESALVAVLLHGLRISEAVSLDAGQLRDGALVGINGKGGKTRTVPITDEAATLVRAYLDGRRSGPMFTNRSGRRLGVRMAQQLVYRISDRTGHRINAHRLRHSAATHWLRSGLGLAQVQDLLGHSKADTTRIYARLTVDDLKTAVDSVPMLGSGSNGAGGQLLAEGSARNPAPTESYPTLRVVNGGRHG